MEEKSRFLVVVPARAGSKGVPGKNSKLLNGIPLINYTLNEAKKVFPLQDIFVSTDSEDIIDIAEKNNIKVPFKRPVALASDTASSYDVLIHAISSFEALTKEYDTIVLLQPTSPFRTADHIKEALSKYSKDLDMVVSVKITEANPYYILVEENENGFLKKSKEGNFSRRQDVPEVYELNGAIYVINIASLKKGDFSTFKKTKKVLMDQYSSLDIDTPLDWVLAEHLLKSQYFHNT